MTNQQYELICRKYFPRIVKNSIGSWVRTKDYFFSSILIAEDEICIKYFKAGIGKLTYHLLTVKKKDLIILADWIVSQYEFILLHTKNSLKNLEKLRKRHLNYIRLYKPQSKEGREIFFQTAEYKLYLKTVRHIHNLKAKKESLEQKIFNLRKIR